VPPFNGDCFLKGLFGLVIASLITVGRVSLPYNSLTEDHAAEDQDCDDGKCRRLEQQPDCVSDRRD
jgi:hypothetical protein